MAFDIKSDSKHSVEITAPTKPLGLFASYRAARRNVLELVPEAACHKATLQCSYRAPWIMLMDPDATQHIMLTCEENYPKSAILKRIMTPREGSNLIIAEGADWQQQRKFMAASFTPHAIENIAEVVTQAASPPMMAKR